MNAKIQCYDEIVTQKWAWQEAVETTLQKKTRIHEFFDTVKPTEIFFIGCTSPYYAGIAAAGFWKIETGIAANALPSSELLLYPQNYYSDSHSSPVLIALSRSGKTTETIWAVEEFDRRYPGRTVLIGCNPEGPLPEMAKLKILLPNSAEKTIAQTRSLCSMLISALIMACIHSNNQTVIEKLEQSPAHVEPIIKNSEEIVKALFQSRRYNNIFILGSGLLYGIACEAGLKCMEMSTTDTFSYHFLESRHGPRSLIDENSLVVGLYSRGGLDYEAQLMEEYTLKNGATTLALVPEYGWKTGNVSATVSVDCDWPDGFIGLAYLPVTQLIAYYCSLSKGLNPDIARNHSPYVEIQRF